MTVKELITRLLDYDLNLKVNIRTFNEDDSGLDFEVTLVDVDFIDDSEEKEVIIG